MNKEEIVAHLAEEAGVTKAAAGKVLNALTDLVLDRAAEGQETLLHKFGTFKPKDRAARQGRNPSNGAPIQIPAQRLLAFKASKITADRLN